MKIIKVTYTAKAEYTIQNQANIKNVMADLQKLNRPGINYNSCLGPDGKTFIHTAFFKSEEDEKVLTGLSSFILFQKQLQSEGIETPPKQEVLNLVGTSKKIFEE